MCTYIERIDIAKGKIWDHILSFMWSARPICGMRLFCWSCVQITKSGNRFIIVNYGFLLVSLLGVVIVAGLTVTLSVSSAHHHHRHRWCWQRYTLGKLYRFGNMEVYFFSQEFRKKKIPKTPLSELPSRQRLSKAWNIKVTFFIEIRQE